MIFDVDPSGYWGDWLAFISYKDNTNGAFWSFDLDTDADGDNTGITWSANVKFITYDIHFFLLTLDGDICGLCVVLFSYNIYIFIVDFYLWYFLNHKDSLGNEDQK